MNTQMQKVADLDFFGFAKFCKIMEVYFKDFVINYRELGDDCYDYPFIEISSDHFILIINDPGSIVNKQDFPQHTPEYFEHYNNDISIGYSKNKNKKFTYRNCYVYFNSSLSNFDNPLFIDFLKSLLVESPVGVNKMYNKYRKEITLKFQEIFKENNCVFGQIDFI